MCMLLCEIDSVNEKKEESSNKIQCITEHEGTPQFCRLELASLHFNENSSSDQAVTKQGKEQI